MADADDTLGALKELEVAGIIREIENDSFFAGRRWKVLILEGIPDHGWLWDMYQTYGEIRYYGA